MSIEFKEVTHIYSPKTPFEYTALNLVSVEIKPQSFTAIIGQTGSGKSTLIQHLNGLLKPTSGAVYIEDYILDKNKNNKSLKQLRNKVGLVFQFPEYQLFESTVEKDIMFGPMNFGMNEADAKLVAKEVIQQVGLDVSYLERSPFELSGGQKRRVAIAGILAMNPSTLVLDEPTAGLDPQGAKEMMDLFKQLNQSGKTVVLVTHDMNHVLNYASEVIVMSKSTVKATGTVKDIFNNHQLLTELNLGLPLITQFINDLNDNGFHLDSSMQTPYQMAKAIKEVLK